MKLIKYFPLLFVFITLNAMAKPLMYATIRGDHKISAPYLESYFNFATAKEARYQFPITDYSFPLKGYDLKYAANISDEDRPSDLDGKTMSLSDFDLQFYANLKLISFDKNTGHYLFRLTFDTPSLKYTGHGPLWMVGGRSISGKPKLLALNSSNLTFDIEGVYQNINGENILHSYNKNPYFDIDFLRTSTGKNLELRLLNSFPVMVVN